MIKQVLEIFKSKIISYCSYVKIPGRIQLSGIFYEYSYNHWSFQLSR